MSGESVHVCPKINVCMCSEVPEVHRDDGRTAAAPRRSLATRTLPLFQMQHFPRPLPPLSLPDQHLQVGRVRIYGNAGDGGGRFSLLIPRLADFSDGCRSGRGQMRRRWRREIPGIPVSVVRNVALISTQPDKSAAGTRIAPQADEADGYFLDTKFLFRTPIFWASASHAVRSVFSPGVLQVKMQF